MQHKIYLTVFKSEIFQAVLMPFLVFKSVINSKDFSSFTSSTGPISASRGWFSSIFYWPCGLGNHGLTTQVMFSLYRSHGDYFRHRLGSIVSGSNLNVLNGWELNLYHVPRNGLAKIVSAVPLPIFHLIVSAMQSPNYPNLPTPVSPTSLIKCQQGPLGTIATNNWAWILNLDNNSKFMGFSVLFAW